jgi:hypothetical protein
MDREVAHLHGLAGALGGLLVGQVELAQRLRSSVTRRAGRVAAGVTWACDGPVLLRAEGLDLDLAVDDQAQRDRLHAAGGLGARAACARAPARG